MHPTLLPRPFHHDGWVYEEKVDGYRMVVYKDDEGVRLVSRNGRDHTRRFPELVKALGGLKPKSFMLDGEVALIRASSRGLNGCAPSRRMSPPPGPSTSPLTSLSWPGGTYETDH